MTGFLRADRRSVRVLLLGTVLLAAMQVGGAGGAAAQAAGGGQAQAVPAGVITLDKQAVPVTVRLTGQAAALESADIRPLVDGILTKVLYRAGQDVEVGTPLFQIDPRSYDAALASAGAELESARAAVPAAQANLDRYEKLAGTGVTQADLDTARVTLRQAEASVAAAEAAVDTARINLDRTTITSPIVGVAEIPAVSVGDLVTSGQSDALTTVTGLDPIYVDVSESSARVLEQRGRMARGEVTRGEELDVQLTLENGEVYTGKGKIVTMSRTVSTTTGTVTIRFEFDNPDHLILPGMFLRVQVTLGTAQAFLVPQLAATPNADGTLTVWTLDAEGKAAEHRLTAIGSTDSSWIVAEGLEDGTRLVLDNITKMKAGATVTPIEASIRDGVVIDGPAAGGAAQGGAATTGN